MRTKRKRRTESMEIRKTMDKLIENVNLAEAESEHDRKLDGYIEIKETAEKNDWGREGGYSVISLRRCSCFGLCCS